MRSPASEQKERERVEKREREAREIGKHRVCRLMKTNSIFSQLEMKYALKVFGAVCVCVNLRARPCGSVCDYACLCGCDCE